MAQYTYGSVTINNGTKFRARRDEETRVISYMTHHGKKNASTKIAKSFVPGGDASVMASNRYQFQDEYLNEHASQASSEAAKWKIH